MSMLRYVSGWQLHHLCLPKVRHLVQGGNQSSFFCQWREKLLPKLDSSQLSSALFMGWGKSFSWKCLSPSVDDGVWMTRLVSQAVKKLALMIPTPCNDLNCTLNKRYLVCYFLISFPSSSLSLLQTYRLLYSVPSNLSPSP